jgi:hypothetical protein
MILIVRTTGWPIEFPLTAEIAARCYQLEMARIARGSAKRPRMNARIKHDYFRLCAFADPPWRR